MDEVFKYQESITDSIKTANDKHDEIEKVHDIDQTISRARDYYGKIVNLRHSLIALKDRTTKLGRRATKISENKNREDIERQRHRKRREMLEKHLEPVVNTRQD